MFGSQILDIAIGIIFVYLLVSVICSSVKEGLEALLKTRAAYLENGIRQLLANGVDNLDGEKLASELYQHPSISGLYSGKYSARKPLRLTWWFATGGSLPSYIPSRNFATALIDIAVRGPVSTGADNGTTTPLVSLSALRATAEKNTNPNVHRALITAIDAAQGDINKVQANIEDWYNSAMDRVSGWYKRSTQWILLIIGLFIAVTLNINTFTIAKALYKDDVVRAAVEKRAEALGSESSSTDSIPAFNKAKDQLEMDLPVGWGPSSGIPPTDQNFGNFAALFLGWLMTGLAATMGAPFWFDVLNKFTVIRSTVKPHEKSLEESSKDPVSPGSDRLESLLNTNLGGAAVPGTSGNTEAPDENSIDGCDVATEFSTPDEGLPASQGGEE